MATNPTDDDLLIVAAAYRQEMLAGHGDLEAYRAAFEAYSKRYPEKTTDTAAFEVSRLIFETSAGEDGWIYGRDG